jgi:orotate phosphoribosyltransferase
MSSTFDLSAALLNAGAVRLSPSEPFTWASGLKSPIYCDNRQLLGFPSIRAEIAAALVAAIKTGNKQPTLIAGTSTAGIPWATLAAEQMALPLAYVRPEPKKHGMARQIEGPLTNNHSVVLIEDLISTGGSSLKCVEALRGEGAEVIEILALFSYGLIEAETAFNGANVPWRVLANFHELIKKAIETSAITHAGQESLIDWRRSPQEWSATRSSVSS